MYRLADGVVLEDALAALQYVILSKTLSLSEKARAWILIEPELREGDRRRLSPPHELM